MKQPMEPSHAYAGIRLYGTQPYICEQTADWSNIAYTYEQRSDMTGTQLYIGRQRIDSCNIAIYIWTDIKHDEKSHKCVKQDQTWPESHLYVNRDQTW